MPSFWGSSQPRDQTQVSRIAGGTLCHTLLSDHYVKLAGSLEGGGTISKETTKNTENDLSVVKEKSRKECYLYEKFDFKGAILNQKKKKEKKKNIDDCKQLCKVISLSSFFLKVTGLSLSFVLPLKFYTCY